MGTRADFYVGVGENAEWIGSVGWDGYEWAEDKDCPLLNAKTEDDFRAAVYEIAADRDDWTDPEQGWPWPWDDSRLTDYTYYFQDGKTGFDAFSERDDWPDMSDKKNLTLGRRSGLMVFSGP